jgi:hypothetical protein
MKNKHIELSIIQQRGYSNLSDDLAFSIVRLKNDHINLFGGKGKWVKITSHKNKVIYRKIKGAGKPDLPKDALEIDFDGFNELECFSKEEPIKTFYPTNLKIVKATWFEALKAHWYHPDPAYSMPMRLGYIGLVLGVVGFLLSLIGLLK